MGRISLRKACRKKEKIYLCSSGWIFKFPGSVRVRRIFTVRFAARHNRTAAGAIKIPPALSVYGIPGPLPQPGIFLPFCHFEHEMEKTVELANGIGLGCREAILAEIKALKNDPKNKTAGV